MSNTSERMVTRVLAGVALVALAWGVFFIVTHETESYNCKYSIDADASMCDFRWVGK
jgi:hypothetical protein